MGVSFSQKHISALTEDRRKDGRNEYDVIEYWLNDDEFYDILQSIVREIGDKKLLFDDHILGYDRHHMHNRFYCSDPEKFGFILEHFNQKQMKKMCVMKCTILEDSAACLEICTKHGWLTKPGDCDELIEWASEENKTECLAFLLDYQNRNFDLAAEREKAERIARRKLNAASDSVTALRELFRWKKQEDGTLVITGYKGTSDVIYVPAKIGRSAVTAIGKRAFTKVAKLDGKQYITSPEFQPRKIVLPDGIKHIWEQAFTGCNKLESINIPDGVTDIADKAFTYCHSLTEAVLPASVTVIGDGAFSNCENLTAVVEPNSYAEEYCKQNNVPFRHGKH